MSLWKIYVVAASHDVAYWTWWTCAIISKEMKLTHSKIHVN